MRWLRFRDDSREYTGYLDSGRIVAVTGDIYSNSFKETGKTFSLDEIEWLPPCAPGKIIGIGLNYRDHAREMKMELPDEPIMFLKADTALLPHMGKIVCPPGVRRVDYEAELAVVIGKAARHVSVEEALDYVFGYTCGNDVTARDVQKKDGQWVRAKSYDTFCPLGPWIVTGLDPSDLAISLLVNGEEKQRSRTSQLAFDVAQLVSFLSKAMTLKPGDVILTGTPSGVGPLKPGDRVSVIIEGIGELTNTVVSWE